MLPKLKDAYVSHETIYNAIYALPVGELRKELVHCLRHGKTTRRPRAGGVDRRNHIPDMVSIHLRAPEIEDRLVPGHWEGGFDQGQCVCCGHAGLAHERLADAGQNERYNSHAHTFQFF